jgi:hypothetical protein
MKAMMGLIVCLVALWLGVHVPWKDIFFKIVELIMK